MDITIIDSRFVHYITAVCDILNCTPQELVEDALKLHEVSFKVVSHALFMSCNIRDIERNLSSVGDGD